MKENPPGSGLFTAPERHWWSGMKYPKTEAALIAFSFICLVIIVVRALP